MLGLCQNLTYRFSLIQFHRQSVQAWTSAKMATKEYLSSFQIGKLHLIEPMLTDVAHFNTFHCFKLRQQIGVQIFLTAVSRVAVWNLCILDSLVPTKEKLIHVFILLCWGFKRV